MTASLIRASARANLTGKWGKVALQTFVYSIIIFAIFFLLSFLHVIGNIVWIIIAQPLSYGLLTSFIKIKRGEEINYIDFLSIGFSSFSKVWGIIGTIILKMIFPICLLVILSILVQFGFVGALIAAFKLNSIFAVLFIVSILAIIGLIALSIYISIKGLLYSLSFYIRYDNPDMTSKEVVDESEKLMRGNRWKYVWLSLTFFGWMILASLPLGIGFLWLIPYMAISNIVFYENLSNKSNDIEVLDDDINNPIVLK